MIEMMLKRLFDIAIVLIFSPIILTFVILISFTLLLKQGKAYFFCKIELEKIIKYLNFINLEQWKQLQKKIFINHIILI